VAKTRRNDPCPCGSGKKYKNCCLRKDQVVESRARSLTPVEAMLISALQEYANRSQFRGDLISAFGLYWGGNYDPAGLTEADADNMRRMFEWFTHDYVVNEEGERVIDLFVREMGNRLSPEVRALAEAWVRSTMGCFRVTGLPGGDRLQLYDCLRGQELEAVSAALAHNTMRGDLLIGRLYMFQGQYRLSVSTLILPAAFEDPLVQYVRRAYEVYRDLHPQASWERFLRENGHIFTAFLLSAEAQPLRSLLGPGSRYQDMSATRDRLHAFSQRRAAEQEAPTQRDLVDRLGRRTPSGIIVPGSEETERKEQPTIIVPGRDT